MDISLSMGRSVEGIPTSSSRHQVCRVGLRRQSVTAGPSSHPSSERAAVAPLASPMRQQQHLHLRDNRFVAMAAGVGQFWTDLALPSLVRRPTTRGSIFGSVTCNTWRRRRFDVESRPPFAGGLGFHPGEVRLLQVASSIDGHKCVGSPASPLTGFGFHFKDLVGGIFGGGHE
jgi:hypothetical protein